MTRDLGMPQPPVKRGGLIISRSSFREMCRHRYSHATTEIDIAARQKPAPTRNTSSRKHYIYNRDTIVYRCKFAAVAHMLGQTDRQADGRTDAGSANNRDF